MHRFWVRACRKHLPGNLKGVRGICWRKHKANGWSIWKKRSRSFVLLIWHWTRSPWDRELMLRSLIILRLDTLITTPVGARGIDSPMEKMRWLETYLAFRSGLLFGERCKIEASISKGARELAERYDWRHIALDAQKSIESFERSLWWDIS